MRKICYAAFGVVMAVLLLAKGAALAADEQAVDLKITSMVDKLVVNEKGERQMASIETTKTTVVPGDVVTFVLSYKNVGKAEVSNIAIQNPIPKEMLYRHASAGGEAAEVSFSVDGGKSFDKPERLFVKDKDGKARQAGVEDYTDVRWIVRKSLAPGAVGAVTYKALLK